MADGRGQMAVSLGHDDKKTVVISVRTSANGQIVKISKTQNFWRCRSVRQNDHYFRSYMTQKSVVILYELLYTFVF